MWQSDQVENIRRPCLALTKAGRRPGCTTSYGSELPPAPSKPSNLRTSAAASFHCCGHCCCGGTFFSWGSEIAACPLQKPLYNLFDCRLPPSKPSELPSTASCGRTIFSWGSETAAGSRTFEPPLPSTASCGRNLRPSAPTCGHSFLGVPRLPPPLQLRPCTLQLPSTAVAVPALKTFDPPLQLPATAPHSQTLRCSCSFASCGHCGCGRAVFSWGSETGACPLQNHQNPPLQLRPYTVQLPSTARCGRAVFSWGSETAACPLQNPQALRSSFLPLLALPSTASCGACPLQSPQNLRQLPSTAPNPQTLRCSFGRTRCSFLSLLAMAIQSFLGVPRLPPAPFKTLRPSAAASAVHAAASFHC